MTRRNLAVVPDDAPELDEAGLPPDHLGDLTVNGRPRCIGIKANGRRCEAFRDERTKVCWQHTDGRTREERVARAKKGGSVTNADRAQRMMPTRLRPVFDLLSTAMREVYEGTLSPTRATAMASVASASVRVLESGELEERLRRIENASADDDDMDEGGMGAEEEE